MDIYKYNLDSRDGFNTFLNDIIEYSHRSTRVTLYLIAIILDDVITIETNDIYKQNSILKMFELLRQGTNELKVKSKKMKLKINKKIPIYSTDDIDDTDYDDMTTRSIGPIERHVHGLDDGLHDDNDNVIKIMAQLQFRKNTVERLYHLFNIYVNILTIKIQFLKSQIFKMEIARKGQQSGTVLDLIIYNYLDEYINVDKEFRYYCKELKVYSNINQWYYLTYINGNHILQKYFKIEFCYRDELPLSVLKEKKRQRQKQ